MTDDTPADLDDIEQALRELEQSDLSAGPANFVTESRCTRRSRLAAP